jgi:hypothetical protein
VRSILLKKNSGVAALCIMVNLRIARPEFFPAVAALCIMGQSPDSSNLFFQGLQAFVSRISLPIIQNEALDAQACPSYPHFASLLCFLQSLDHVSDVTCNEHMSRAFRRCILDIKQTLHYPTNILLCPCRDLLGFRGKPLISIH